MFATAIHFSVLRACGLSGAPIQPGNGGYLQRCLFINQLDRGPSRQRFCRRYPLLHRRIRACRSLHRFAHPTALLRSASALPGHGRVSLTPIDDINHAIAIAQRLLKNRQSGEPDFLLRPWRIERAQAGFTDQISYEVVTGVNQFSAQLFTLSLRE